MLSLISPVLDEVIDPLGLQVKPFGKNACKISFTGLKKLKWKGRTCSLAPFKKSLGRAKGAKIKSSDLVIDAKITIRDLLTLRDILAEISELIQCENLDYPDFWGTAKTISPTGFNEADDSYSKKILAKLYKDDFIVAEKKAFIIDLARSQDSFLMTAGPKRVSVLDAAGQIASLAVGLNHKSKVPMALRPESLSLKLNGPESEASANIQKWDVTQAYARLLKEESGLSQVNFVCSGSEAIEVALRGCQQKYPDRKKIIAFEGSFHGRTLLALHATYNPSKREPFEIFKGRVDFINFPEDKAPTHAMGKEDREPSNWLAIWSDPDADGFGDQIMELKKTTEELLKTEIDILLEIYNSIKKDKPLAVIVEPMQCEGGDRYGTPRFFRGLRILTRALDTPLVFDEVQTGFGLSGTFFWHKRFKLEDASGNPDFPDAVTIAKKAQIGACLSNEEQDIPVETSAASIHRGYLHANSIRETHWKPIEDEVGCLLKSMEKSLQGCLTYPRWVGSCFAFDLEDGKVLAKLVEQRFQNGLLFYPAGSNTARFRLMASTSVREIRQIMVSLYRCFIYLSESGVIGKIDTLGEWIEGNAEDRRNELEAISKEKAGIKWMPHWANPGTKLPKTLVQFKAVTREEWSALFINIIKNVPEIMHAPSTMKLDLEKLNRLSSAKLWDKYKKDNAFTLLDLLWHASRRFGHHVERLDKKSAKKMIPAVTELEKVLYESERQDDPVMLAEMAKKPESIYLASFEKKKLSGICVAGPLSNFDHLKMISSDPSINDPKALYSIDLSIYPDRQGVGLGLRFKCEQYMEAIRQGSTLIRSRNRYPEAEAMVSLNQKISSVVVDKNTKDYGGDATALYQSVTIPTVDKRLRRKSPYLPAIRNKVSLGNFVSPTYVRNLSILREFLPERLRHIYLTSGKAETVDKMIKLLRTVRKEALVALSFNGDYFGTTSASARSLGGCAGPSYFDWPVLENESELEAQLSDPEKILGVFIEPISELSQEKKSLECLKKLVKICKAKNVPVVLHETTSAFFQYDKGHFLIADEVGADASLVYCGGQLGFVAVAKQFFLSQPLMMISTWDGDEHSLNLMRERILASCCR